VIRDTIPGHSARQENFRPQIPGLKKYDISTGARSQHPPGRAGVILWPCYILTRLSRPGIAPKTGPRPAILPTSRTGTRSSTFSIQRTF